MRRAWHFRRFPYKVSSYLNNTLLCRYLQISNPGCKMFMFSSYLTQNTFEPRYKDSDTNTHVYQIFIYRTYYNCTILTKLKFGRQILQKFPGMKLRETSSVWLDRQIYCVEVTANRSVRTHLTHLSVRTHLTRLSVRTHLIRPNVRTHLTHLSIRTHLIHLSVRTHLTHTLEIVILAVLKLLYVNRQTDRHTWWSQLVPFCNL